MALKLVVVAMCRTVRISCLPHSSGSGATATSVTLVVAAPAAVAALGVIAPALISAATVIVEIRTVPANMIVTSTSASPGWSVAAPWSANATVP